MRHVFNQRITQCMIPCGEGMSDNDAAEFICETIMIDRLYFLLKTKMIEVNQMTNNKESKGMKQRA